METTKAWQTHDWRQRVLIIEGVTKREHLCAACQRRLVEFNDSGEYFAAYASVFDFEPLYETVMSRWLIEPCPKQQMPADKMAYENRPTASRSNSHSPGLIAEPANPDPAEGQPHSVAEICDTPDEDS